MTLSGEAGRQSYAVIGDRLGMTERAVQMAAHRLRRRYGKTIRALIAETVSDPALIDDEIRDLFACAAVVTNISTILCEISCSTLLL